MSALQLQWSGLFLIAGQTFRKGREFTQAAVGLPDNATVIEQSEDRAVRRAAQRLDSVAGLEGGGFAEAFDDANHALPVEHAGNVVGDGGYHLTPAAGGQVGKKRGGKLSSDIGEGIAIEEEEGGTAMTVPEEI
jgi:hypothetical protein